MLMASEYEKGIIELSIFKEFAAKAGLKVINGSARKSDPNQGKPDIYCHLHDGPAYFELTEACAPAFAAAISNGSWEDQEIPFIWGSDVTEETVEKKLQKTYQVSEPVELLIYTAGRTTLPDAAIASKIRDVLINGSGPFRRIWLYGEQIMLLYPSWSDDAY